MNETPQIAPTEDSLLIELDALFKRYRQVEHVAVWGGSFEREHGARMELKPVVNKMFDTLLALLECRASRPKAAGSVGARDNSDATGASTPNPFPSSLPCISGNAGE